MTAAACSPVAARWRVDGAGTVPAGEPVPARVTVRVDPAEPVFAGHYPGFPIFPGVCVLECVHRTAQAALSPGPDGTAGLDGAAGPDRADGSDGAAGPDRADGSDGAAAWELAAIESTRFLNPVFPGDELAIELSWTPQGAEWRCSAAVQTARAKVAQVRLRYRVGDGRS